MSFYTISRFFLEEISHGKCRKCHFGASIFHNFLGEDVSTPLTTSRLWHPFSSPPRSSPIENTLHCPCLTHPFSHNSCYIHNLFHIFFIRNRRNLFKVYCAHFVHFYLNSFQEIFCCQTVWTTAYLTLF